MSTNSTPALDFTNFDKVIKRLEDGPEHAIRSATPSDFRLIAWQMGEEAYSQLMDKLKGDDEAQALLFAYSHLKFVAHEFESLTIGDIPTTEAMMLKLFSGEPLSDQPKRKAQGKK